MSDIREVTFSKLLELDFSGRVVEKSITLGDIDNDSVMFVGCFSRFCVLLSYTAS